MVILLSICPIVFEFYMRKRKKKKKEMKKKKNEKNKSKFSCSIFLNSRRVS